MTRGRKKDLSIPPTRALTQQRAYRARRAQYVADLEERCRRYEEENTRLRRELDTALRAAQANATAPWANNPETVHATSDLVRNLASTSASIARFQRLMPPPPPLPNPDVPPPQNVPHNPPVPPSGFSLPDIQSLGSFHPSATPSSSHTLWQASPRDIMLRSPQSRDMAGPTGSRHILASGSRSRGESESLGSDYSGRHTLSRDDNEESEEPGRIDTSGLPSPSRLLSRPIRSAGSPEVPSTSDTETMEDDNTGGSTR